MPLCRHLPNSTARNGTNVAHLPNERVFLFFPFLCWGHFFFFLFFKDPQEMAQDEIKNFSKYLLFSFFFKIFILKLEFWCFYFVNVSIPRVVRHSFFFFEGQRPCTCFQAVKPKLNVSPVPNTHSLLFGFQSWLHIVWLCDNLECFYLFSTLVNLLKMEVPASKSLFVSPLTSGLSSKTAGSTWMETQNGASHKRSHVIV